MSAKRKNDYSAIVAVGRGIDNYFYVLEADVQKRTPDKIIEDAKEIIARYYKYKPSIVVETNQMQAFFSSTLKRDMVNTGIYLDWIEVYRKPGDSKCSRIESLVPHIKNGYIKFKASQKILLSQLRNYPKGHDDAPDCLESALAPMLSSNKASFGFSSAGAAPRRAGGAFDLIKKAIGMR